MTKLKKKFVNVVPLSPQAKYRFDDLMDNFHSCLVLDENDDLYHLISLNGMYQFHLQKSGNEHWKIVR